MSKLCGVVILLGACGWRASAKGPEADPCLPASVDLGTMEPAAQSIVTRRALVCHDHRHGRISDEEYATRVAALDGELAGKRIAKRPQPQPEPRPLIVWASAIIDFSSQYAEEAWSVNQLLGAPDVYPGYGDHDKAWASRGADDRDEWVEVGFGSPERTSGLEIYETFNPGAIDQIELITVTGKRVDVPVTQAQPTQTAVKRLHAVRCTQERIQSVRVHLDSARVPGWNEIDAIGLVPCTR